MRYTQFISVVLLGVLTSCHSTRSPIAPVPAGFPDHTAEQVLSHLPTPDSLWSTFRVEAALAFATSDGSGSFSAHILVHRPDSILIRIRAPLGIEVARALVTADSVLMYDRVERTLYSGPVDSGLLPAGLRSTDLSASFFGFDPVPPGGWSNRGDSLLYRLERNDGLTLLVDPRWWRITARDSSDASGVVAERRRFTEFQRYDGLVLPRRIVTIRPLEGTRASFFVRKVEAYPADTNMDLGVREDARRIVIH